METRESILAGIPFFEGMERRLLQELAACAANVRIDAGHYIFREGEDANHFYVIREGKVAVMMMTPTRGAVTIQTLESGDILGWSWLVEPHRWRFDARALEPTKAVALNGTCLREQCAADDKLGHELFRRFAGVIAKRLEAARLQLLDVYAKEA